MNKRLVTIGWLCTVVLIVSGIAFASPVPDTGQTKCYDAAGNVIACPSPGSPLYGQFANYSLSPMSYTKLDGSGNALPDSAASWSMVKDNVTGLTWEAKTGSDGVQNYSDPHDADNTYTWYDSNQATNGGNAGTSAGDGKNTEAFIKSLNDANFGGFSDWRLPTITELANLVDFSIAYPGPSITAAYFSGIPQTWFWSSSTVAMDNSKAWDMDYKYSYNYDDAKSAQGHVMAVHGGAAAAQVRALTQKLSAQPVAAYSPLTDNGDGTVTDSSTGLMWQKTGSGDTMTWENALSYCTGLNLGGYTDWRLPTIKEAWSLVDYDNYLPAIDTSFFTDVQAFSYWTSTTYSYNPSHGWTMDFQNGYANDGDKTYYGYVRAVRGGLMTIGALPGIVQASLAAKQRADFQINSTNSRGETPRYQWFLLTGIVGSNALPVYVISAKGSYDLNQVLPTLSEYTFPFDASGVNKIGVFSMSDLGLKTGDALIYGYAYMNVSGTIYIDNIVDVTVK